jgi:hypothetical protein
LWALAGTASLYGLPTGTLRDGIDRGFVAGAHIAGIAVTIILIGCMAYAVGCYYPRRSAT